MSKRSLLNTSIYLRIQSGLFVTVEQKSTLSTKTRSGDRMSHPMNDYCVVGSINPEIRY